MTLRSWRLDDATATLLLAADDDRLPQVVHWGAPLPASDGAATLARAHAIDRTGGMLDATPDLSLCPESWLGFPGQPGLDLAAADGTPLAPRFALASEDAANGLVLAYRDAAHGLTLTFRLTLAHDLLTATTTLDADAPVRLRWLAAPVLPAPPHADAVLDFGGRWCGELAPVRTPWTPGIRLRESRTGRSDHAHFPGAILTAPGTTNAAGEAWAFHYAWSGGHRMIAEELPDGRRQIQWGHAAGAETAPGTRFETAPLLAAYSAAGLNGCATAFQRHVRDRLVPWPDPARPRPVHYNCWEAVYFDHDPATLMDIATRAAALGAERFVLDDGWFGRRNDDTSSLGDWQVDSRKWPDGLTPLIDHCRARGMSFGLWVEPEMANPDSDLARARPDWLLGPDDQPLGRQQRVLDMGNPDVRDHLHAALSALLCENAIDYLKWDHNRTLPGPDADQTRGTHALLDRLRADFPALEIESCASGGGRIDLGMLARTHRVWLSDSNDALERLRIQADAALWLPAAVTGSHVGPRRCHTTGRTLPMSLRAWTAAQRHMGFEMDPRELTPEEAATLTRVTRWWKANRNWTMRADIHRLDPAVVAELHLSDDGARFVAFAARVATSAQIAPRPLRLTALDPAARYRVTLANRDEAPALSRGDPLLKRTRLEASGAWLMSHGPVLPWSLPETMWVLEGARL